MHHKVHFFTHTFLFWTSSVPHSASTSNPSRCDLPFWTSQCHSSASTSNPPRFDFLFGLLRAIPPLQRPIHHALTSFLDFSVPFLRFNVQSTTLWLPFWTSSVPYSASTSNPPCFDFLLDFFLPFLHFNVQSATLQFHATLCITFPPHSPSSFEYSILEH